MSDVWWTFTIDAPCPWMTANGRGRWAIAHGTRIWRGAAFQGAQLAGLPTGLTYARIEMEARFRGTPPVRDRMNLYPTVKAVMDGLGPSRVTRRTPYAVGWGLVPDDDDKHVDGPYLSIGPKLPTTHRYANVGQLLVTITDLSEVGGQRG